MNFFLLRSWIFLIKSKAYKERNHTAEANVIRALYIRNKSRDIYFSQYLEDYIASQVICSEDSKETLISKYIQTKRAYPKYGDLKESELVKLLTAVH